MSTGLREVSWMSAAITSMTGKARTTRTAAATILSRRRPQRSRSRGRWAATCTSRSGGRTGCASTKEFTGCAMTGIRGKVRARTRPDTCVTEPTGSDDVSVCGVACGRSEEHTSELQSRLHLVCRLLLEKKNLALPTMLEPRHTLVHPTL